MVKKLRKLPGVYVVHKAARPPPKKIGHRNVDYIVTTGPNGPKISSSMSVLQTLEKMDESATVPVGISEEMDVDTGRGILPENGEDQLDIPLDAAYLSFLGLSNKAPEKIKRIRKQGDEALHHFIPQVGLFVEEMIGLEAPSELAEVTCWNCHENPAQYECRDCWGRDLWCAGCLVVAHARLFLHRILKWNGRFFEKSSLKELGLRVQLGHGIGDKCLNPQSVRSDDFVVVDVDGIHRVSLDFCGCGNTAQAHIIQLLRARLFPATVINPKTVATFRCLQFLEVLSYESKLSAFEFFQTLSRCTDNTGTIKVNDRYPELLRMIHEWRYLKMMKRAGRAHTTGGVEGTGRGECAVLCPACPHPSMNMREDWEQDNPKNQYLHTLFLALDANFRLKRKNVSNGVADPGLIRGAAYFVEELSYMEHLEQYKHEKEPKSTCSRHDAINMSEKSAQGHAAIGIAACVCARHDMKRPRGVADLQRGERYCNMDYVFQETTKCYNESNRLKKYVVSYDIACQWSINLAERMSLINPTCFIFNKEADVRFLVPKFHLPAHVSKCREAYSFNYAPDTGRTDGEAPERGWVYINGLATSTREMGPGSRYDTLDCHIGDENWKKVSGMGASLVRKMELAAREMAEHVLAHRELTSTIADSTIQQWTAVVEAWEADHSQMNPYEVTISGPSQASVLRELAEDEARAISSSRDMSLDEKITPSVLISLGLELEREQRRMNRSSRALWDHALDRQKTKHQLQLNTLQRKIDSWIMYQQLYIPAVTRLRHLSERKRNETTTTTLPELKAYEIELLLPSQIDDLTEVPTHLKRIEWKLRHSQAHEALDTLQTQLQIRAHLYKFKDRFVRGQGANTRARNTINGTNAKIDTAAEDYRAAYAALTALAPSLNEVSWRNELLPLLPEDIRDVSEGKTTRKGKESEGKRTLSWIWKKVPVENLEDDGYLTDRMRSEWCKSRARALRLREEVSLLWEEMLRVKRYFDWKVNDWNDKRSLTIGSEQRGYIVQKEGRVAYAERQAQMYRDMKMKCEELWQHIPAYVNRMLTIIATPSLAQPGELDGPLTETSKYQR